MGWLRFIYITAGIAVGLWGIPGMIEDYYVWVEWFKDWQWWNFVMVIGGWSLAIWASAPLWKPLFVGKEIQEVPAAETPEEDENEMSEEMKALLENLKEALGAVALVFYFLLVMVVIIVWIRLAMKIPL